MHISIYFFIFTCFLFYFYLQYLREDDLIDCDAHLVSYNLVILFMEHVSCRNKLMVPKYLKCKLKQTTYFIRRQKLQFTISI